MTPQQTLKNIESLIQDNGTDRAITVIFLFIVVVLFGVFIREYIKSQNEKKNQDDKINQNYIDLITKMTETIAKNSGDINNFKTDLKEHSKDSKGHFESLSQALTKLEHKIDVLEENSKNLVTKEMIFDIRQDIQNLKDEIKNKS